MLSRVPGTSRLRTRLFVEESNLASYSLAFRPRQPNSSSWNSSNDIRADPAAYGASIGSDLANVAAAQPLAFNTAMIEAAREHSRDMVTRGYFNHNTPEGINPGQRLTVRDSRGVRGARASRGEAPTRRPPAHSAD